MEIIENIDEWRKEYSDWAKSHGAISGNGDLGDYPFVRNKHTTFVPLRRALSMLNLALISSAGIYIDGTEPFDTGEISFREIPTQVEAEDLRIAARGYDPTAALEDINVQLPLDRLHEFEDNRIIGQLNSVFWSFSGFIPDARRVADEMLPKLVERVKRYDVQAVLLIPASRLCHQTVSLAARALEQTGLPTMTLAVDKQVVESVRPPRSAFYKGAFGSVAGKPNFPEYQRRILDEALRWIEPMGQPGICELVVELETQVEKERGEK